VTVARHLHLDCPTGIAGDMTLAALLHAGVPEAVVREALAALGIPELVFTVKAVERAHVAALLVTGPVETHPGHGRTWNEIRALITDAAGLRPEVRALALRIFGALARAEATIHGVPEDHVHFHEVGGLDAMVDIVGIAAAITHLAPASVSVSPLPLGSGTVETRHGRLPVPAPATVELLKGVPVVPGPPGAGELVTPTGAAVVATLATSFGPPPPLRLTAQGFGAGSRELPGAPNAVRVLVGDLALAPAAAEGWIEGAANIDDMSPEVGPYLVERLLAAGARDAWQAPILMKKGRAAVQVGFLCQRGSLDAVAAALLDESTSLGLRYHAVERVERPRTSVTVETPFGPVRVKVCGDPATTGHLAPELEDCQRAAREHRVPLKAVFAAAIAAASR
jgi:hypothetical protein